MKKLLSLLGAFGLTATASATVVACGDDKKSDDTKPTEPGEVEGIEFPALSIKIGENGNKGKSADLSGDALEKFKKFENVSLDEADMKSIGNGDVSKGAGSITITLKDENVEAKEYTIKVIGAKLEPSKDKEEGLVTVGTLKLTVVAKDAPAPDPLKDLASGADVTTDAIDGGLVTKPDIDDALAKAKASVIAANQGITENDFELDVDATKEIPKVNDKLDADKTVNYVFKPSVTGKDAYQGTSTVKVTFKKG